MPSLTVPYIAFATDGRHMGIAGVVGAAKDCEKCGTVSMQCNNCNRGKHNGPLWKKAPFESPSRKKGHSHKYRRIGTAPATR